MSSFGVNIHDLTGRTLGQYQIREELGAGGMGAVYLAYQATLDRVVALKVLASELSAESDYVERFNREARMAASLEHSHIVPIYDFGTEGSLSYVVMRLLSGGSLQDKLEKHHEEGKPLPTLRETSVVLDQIAGALDYAHSRGIIHRDIKPTNVMFDNHGSAFVVDFGIAKLVSSSNELTSTGAMLGTPYYMAPEMWRGEMITPAVDQYALATMIYILVTGAMPFQGETPYALMNKHLYETPTPVTSLDEDIPQAINPILMRALAKEPRDRFDTVTEFADAFHQAVNKTKTGNTGFFTAIDLTPILTPAPVSTPPAAPVDDKTDITAPPPPVQASTEVPFSPPPMPTPAPVVTPAPPVTQPKGNNRLLVGGIVGVAVILVGIIGALLLSGGNTDDMTTVTLTALVIVAQPSETPTTAAPSDTPTVEPTLSPTPLVIAQDITTEAPTEAPSATSVPTTEPPPPTAVPTFTSVPPTDVAPSDTPFPTLTETPAPTETATLTPVPPTSTELPSVTPTETPTETATRTATATLTPIPPTLTAIPSATFTPTPLPTETPTLTATFTLTPVPTETATETATPTLTPIPPTLTAIPSATFTFTPTLTETPTETATPTEAFTATPASLCAAADVNKNGEVDILDIRFVAALYGVESGAENYDATYDFDSDGTISILDLRRVASAYGMVCATG